jgi:hypothetical protein
MFEVEFKYYKQKEDLDYNKDEPLVFKNKFGKIDEDYSKEKLAKYILTQLARRDIFIYDVDVYEFTKKKINFKLGKNGFSIAGSKFNNSDLAEDCNLQNDVPAEPQEIPHAPGNHSPKLSIQQPQPQNKFVNLANRLNDAKSRKVMRKVAFVPPLRMDKTKFPYKFTLNKVYPVYSERYVTNGVGMYITTVDDNNDILEVIDEYFVPANTALEFENEMDAGKRGNNDLLNWQGDRSTGPMINLRGK